MLNLASTIVLKEHTNAKGEKWESGWLLISELEALITSAKAAGHNAVNVNTGKTIKEPIRNKVTIKPWTMKNKS